MVSFSFQTIQGAPIAHEGLTPTDSPSTHTQGKRSMGGCIFHSWRSFATGWRPYLASTWHYLLLFGMSCAFLSFILLRYATDHVLPAWRMHEVGMDEELVRWLLVPTAATGIYILLAVLLYLFSLHAWRARVCTMAIGLAKNGRVERVAFNPDTRERRMMARLFVASTLWTAVGLAGCAVFVYPAWRWTPWLLCLPAVWLVYVWTTANCTLTIYATSELSLKVALRTALRRSMGLALLLQMVSWLPFALISCVSLLPTLIYWLTDLAAADTLLRGDTPVAPDFLPLLYFALSTLGFFLPALTDSLRTWALTLFFTGNAAPHAEGQEKEYHEQG